MLKSILPSTDETKQAEELKKKSCTTYSRIKLSYSMCVVTPM